MPAGRSSADQSLWKLRWPGYSSPGGVRRGGSASAVAQRRPGGTRLRDTVTRTGDATLTSIKKLVHPLTGGSSVAHDRVIDLLSGCFHAQAVYVAAKLGIADRLAVGPATAETIARDVGVNPDALARLLRLLAMLGVFSRDGSDRYANTPMSATLISGPGSLRDMAIWWGEEPHWRVYGHLLDSVRTGNCGWPMVHGQDIFPYLADTNPQLGDVFNRAMTSFSATTMPAVLEAYDFAAFQIVADVGGGHGHLLAAILSAAPAARGIVFDLPSAVTGARAVLEEAGVANRARTVAGDFFEPLPFTADCFVLKHIIHDWPDTTCVRLLGEIRAAMPPDGRLLILDMVVPDDDAFHFSKICDMEMLVSAGGRERTAPEFEQLLSAAGLTINRVIATRSIVSIIEAVIPPAAVSRKAS